MNTLWKATAFLSRAMKMGGAACLVIMSALTCVDVVGRFFKHPLFGSVELVGFMGVLAVALSLPFTHETNGHIGVELLMRRFSSRTQKLMETITGLLGFVLFAMVAWRMGVHALNLKQSGEVSINLQLPEYIVVWAVAVCCIVLAVTILKGVIQQFGSKRVP
ncbi:MAG: TRAP transporter small permease [Desulfatitalea sp.]|nr:TRAP transporter small permease [Desulfatitalea sp.]